MVDIAALTSPGFRRSCRTALRRCVLSCRLCIAALWCRIHLSRLLCITTLRRSIRLPRRIAALRCRISLPRRLLHLHLLQVGRRCGAHKSAAEVHAGAHSHEACHRTASVGTGCLKAACHRALYIPLAHRRVAEHRALIPHIDEFLRFFIIGNAGDTD